MAGQFTKIDANRDGFLYVLTGVAPPGPPTWVGVCLSASMDFGPTLSTSDAWTATWQQPSTGINGGVYIVTSATPAAGFLVRVQALLAALNAANRGQAFRYVLWIDDPNPANGSLVAQALAFDGGSDQGTVQLPVALALRNLALVIEVNARINSRDGTSLQFDQFGDTTIRLEQRLAAPVRIGTVSSGATFTLADPATTAGSLALNMTLTTDGPRDDLATLRTGIVYSTGAEHYRKEFSRVIAKETSQQVFTVLARLNPLYPVDTRVSGFTFTGLAGKAGAPVFSCGYYTDFGQPLLLVPEVGAGSLALQPDRTFVKQPGREDGQLVDTCYAAPAGRFHLRLADPSAVPAGTEAQIVCGLAPTEALGFLPGTAGNPGSGDMLVFYPDQPGHAPVFPVPSVDLSNPASPLGDAPLLVDDFTTSYATIVRAAGGPLQFNPYYAQGQGAPLYGNAAPPPPGRRFISDYVLTRAAAIRDEGAKYAFPLTPYLGIAAGGGTYDFPQGDIAPFEAQIVAPVRKQRIFAQQVASGAFAGPARARLAAQDDPIPTTTPQGLLATIASATSARWSSLLLATNEDQGETYKLQFRDLDAVLQAAFQTNQQFLVVTQPSRPWDFGGTGAGANTVFDNTMSIERWPFSIDVGKTNVPGDYNNVLVFKFAKGKLSDLVQHPESWTNAAQFNLTDNIQLALVSQWLQNYIAEARTMAAAGGGSFLKHFLQIVDDPGWNGILALKANVLLQSFPQEIKGLITGIKLDSFFAHHIGVEVNFVTNTDGKPAVSGNSSLFGLINYVDPAYAAWIAANGDPDIAMAPRPGTYDFSVLTLRVLFENSAIKDFQSRVQVTLNEWFGDAVTGTPGSIQPPNAPLSYSVLLDGAYEEHGGASTFTFTGTRERQFALGSNVLGAVDVVKAEFQTLTAAAGAAADSVQSRFIFTGYMNFRPVEGFDLFSFGSDWDTDGPTPGQGLYFSNLYLHMDFDLSAPSVRRFAFDAGEITFNTQLSRARPASFFPNFPLSLDGLVLGAADQKPDTLGYLQVGLGESTAPLVGLREDWHGLAFRLDFGTAGELAAQAGLVATMLLAWSPGSGRTGTTVDASVSIKLPGAGGGQAKLLSLQGVFKLSIGDIELVVGETDTGGQAYMLKLTQIALKFFGIAFPPSGNTVVFLFGDPAKGGAGSKIGWYAAYNKGSKALADLYALEIPREDAPKRMIGRRP